MKQPRAFDLIAFDADDTLWHNERACIATSRGVRFRETRPPSGIPS